MDDKLITDMWLNELKDDNLTYEEKVNIAKLLYINNIIDNKKLKGFAPILDMINNNFNLYDINKFLKSGVIVNELDENGSFPLFRAVENNNRKLMNLLIDFKADINQQYYNNNYIHHSHNGKTVLHLTSERVSICDTFFLLKNKADPNILDVNGDNPINYVLKNRGVCNEKRFHKRELVELLIRFGANPKLLNNKNEDSIIQGKRQHLYIEDIQNKVKLDNAKKKLNIYQGIHDRLGKNSVLKNLPFDVIGLIYENIMFDNS